MLHIYALEALKERQNPFTGFVHQDNAAIATLDNFAFVLALFRSKMTENILEGKRLLEKLFHFQIPYGSFRHHFPVFIHEFPENRDTFLPIKLLPILMHILQDFSPILGQKLHKRLLVSLHRLFKLAEKESYASPYAFTLTVIRHLLFKTPLEKPRLCPAELTSQDWGQMLLAATFIKGSHPELLQELYQEIAFYYHDVLDTFIGACHNEAHEAFQPQLSILDLFLKKNFSKKSSLLMLGSLIRPLDKIAGPSTLRKITSDQRTWFIYRGERYAFTLLEQKNPTSFQQNNHVLRLFWGKGYSLVCQDFNNTIQTQATPNELELLFQLPPDFMESKEDYEISFFWDAKDEMEFLVDGQRATTFTLGQEVKIKKDHLRIVFIFEQREGAGRFFGHLLKGNRPSQVLKPTKTDFTAYDWKLALRTLHRKEPCQIRVRIKLYPS